jgi:hypothetical protein
MPLIPFARQSKAGPDAAGYSGERLKNYFLRMSDGYSEGVLIGRSGLLEQYDLGGAIVAAVDQNGTLFAVAGGTVYKIASGVVTNVGSVAVDDATQMAASGTAVAIVAGGNYYICDGATTAAYTTGALTAPVGVAYIDGYFLVIGTSGGRGDALTVSGLDDGTTFDGLDFAFAETSADDLTDILVDHSEVWLFGRNSVEIWYNSGAADFPFARNTGARIERGAKASTVVAEDNMVFWVGEDGRAYRSGGSAPQVISTREIEANIKDGLLARAFVVDDKGHKFFVVGFSDRPALAYDITTGAWCEFSSGVGESAFEGRCSVRSGNNFYIGTTSGKLATLDPDTYQDLGGYLEAEAVSIPLVNADYTTVNRIHMNIAGGDVNDQGQVMLQVSKDGRTWGVEKWRTLGALGEFFRRVTWHGLGASRRWQIRVKITDAVQRDIYGMNYE